MSYYSTVGGSAGFGGFGYFGLGGSHPIRQFDNAMQDIQRELQRLGYLASGGGVYGADGKFGPRTATALRGAARYVGWTDAAYSPSDAGEKRSGTVTVPEDLVDRLRAASPDPNAPHSGNAPTPPTAPAPPDLTTIGPHLDPEPEPREEGGGSGWVPAAIIGAAVLGVGGVIGYSMYGRRKRPKRNRRRRRRRRRTSRRR